MLKGISSISYEHKVLIERYCSTVTETIKIITGTNASKYNDFMSIIPTNLSIAVQGFLAGYETKRNRAKVRAYRLVLNNLAYDLILDMEEIKLYND